MIVTPTIQSTNRRHATAKTALQRNRSKAKLPGNILRRIRTTSFLNDSSSQLSGPIVSPADGTAIGLEAANGFSIKGGSDVRQTQAGHDNRRWLNSIDEET